MRTTEYLAALWGGACLIFAVGCSSPELAGTFFSCETDADCLDGKLCAERTEGKACIAPSQAPIRIGMTGPLEGPSGDLGSEMRRGILASFARVNAAGGIAGRTLELDARNDNYDPAIAFQNVSEMLDIRERVASPDLPDVRGTDGVFALLGNVGTPTMLSTAPLATKNRVVYFAPFTGSHEYLRDDTMSPYVYNYRAGYYEEAEAMLAYMAELRTPRIITAPPGDSYRRIIVFAQNDSFGDAGYTGIVNAYNRRAPLPQPDPTQPDPSIVRLSYEREDIPSVDPAIEAAKVRLTELLGDGSAPVPVSFVMIDTYQPGNKFIRAIKDWLNEDPVRAAQLDVLFIHVSFVGSDSLAQELTLEPSAYQDIIDPGRMRYYAEGVMVTQVVPYYGTQVAAGVDYRQDIAAFGAPSFTSFEGYIAARLFTEALELHGAPLDTESFRDTLDNRVIDVDIGIGTRLGFSSTNHQASQTVWGSVLGGDGSFSVPFIWNAGSGITPN
jgi:ABC-type branched-subunit amino acid transport system substrate-binding protein